MTRWIRLVRSLIVTSSLLALPLAAAEEASPPLSKAIFAGGCFWCMEQPFDVIEGVVSTTSGYIDGHIKNPSYKQVSSGGSGHTEAVQIVYDPAKVSYERLLQTFWHNIDPTARNRQFCDAGDQYRSGIYYLDEAQKAAAEASLKQLEDSGRFKRIFTEIDPASTFYPAEEYHQDFYKKSKFRYKSYRRGCGRDQRLKEIWGDQAGH